MIPYSMYDEVIEIVENRQYVQAKQKQSKPTILDTLSLYLDCELKEKVLKDDGHINFEALFASPLGHFLLQRFMVTDHSIEKISFLDDVKTYKRMVDNRLRHRIGSSIFKKYCTAEGKNDNEIEATSQGRSRQHSVFSNWVLKSTTAERSVSYDDEDKRDKFLRLQSKFIYSNSNSLGLHGKVLEQLKKAVNKGDFNIDVFNEAVNSVIQDIRMDIFPRFLNSDEFKLYVRIKYVETTDTKITDFTILRCLGKGAFGYVNACIKQNTGTLYAVKILVKSQFQSLKSIVASITERDLLAEMDSPFVVCLKYAACDDKRLYYVLDLCAGGDLKYHIFNDGKFELQRSQLYAAQIILGLEHIHSRGIIYRDIKLENILLDSEGITTKPKSNFIG